MSAPSSSASSSAPSDIPVFDPTTATTLTTNLYRFHISLPILRALVTNPGSEKVTWAPILELRTAKIHSFRASAEELTLAYEAKPNNTIEDEELIDGVWDKYTPCVKDLLEVVAAHKDALPVNERLAAEAAALGAGKRGRLVMAMERSQLGRRQGEGDR